MNYALIKRTLGWILLFLALFFCVPIIAALIYGEEEIKYFLYTGAGAIALGCLCLIGKPKSDKLYAREGIVITALSWVVMSLVGAIPFRLSGVCASYVDALFETVSGFTTTGSTILSGEQIEGMARCMQLWRSFTHWVGGMGVLVFIMVFLPLCGGGRNMNIMRAESPGPSVSKLVPKMRSSAGILYAIYGSLTVLHTIFLLFGGVSFFESLNIAFATAGTGGFGIRGDSFLSYSPYIQVVTTVFMLLYSINFAAYFLLICGKFKDAINAEVRVFLSIVIVAITLITLNLCFTESLLYEYTVGETIRHSAFTVAAIISTTGFVTVDFGMWPEFARTILVMLMFVGACAGSTGGGMKVSRFMIVFKGVRNEMNRMLHPKQIKKITMDNRVVDHETVRGVTNFFMVYIFIFVASLLVVSLDNFDMLTNFTSVTTTINNIGPAVGQMVTPVDSFADFSVLSKFVFIFDMLVGRLEVFPILMLFAPSTWRK